MLSRVLWELYNPMETKWELSIESLGGKGPMGTFTEALYIENLPEIVLELTAFD